MSNYKVEAIERIMFSLAYEMHPFEIIRDVEKFLGVKNCVMHFVAYLGDKYTLTICSTDAVEKLLSNDIIIIGRKRYTYHLCGTKLTRVKILHPPSHLRPNNIDGTVKQFGKILYSEIEKRSNNLCYFAVVDLMKPIPEKITLKRRLCDVVCY